LISFYNGESSPNIPEMVQIRILALLTWWNLELKIYTMPTFLTSSEIGSKWHINKRNGNTIATQAQHKQD
jgi:hypothetical protein